jgi:hypothetical protein
MASSVSATPSDCTSSSGHSDSSDSPVLECLLPPKPKGQTRNSNVKSRPLKENAPWHIMLSLAGQGKNDIADENSADGRYFRRRFRLPYALFESLIQVMLADNWFPYEYEANGRGKLDSCGIRGCSLQVKFLSVLRVLGRGVCFDELYDGSGCSESTLSRFFHQFLIIFNNRLFPCTVKAPATQNEVSKLETIYKYLGLPGTIGSTDCTHIALGKCPVQWRNSCVGKEGFPTVSYSMTCDHTRRIMACSGGFPGTFNDKTISRYDTFITAVGSDELFTNFEYTIQTEQGLETRKGAHLICDGGYHHWSHMICGFKQSDEEQRTLFSSQLESVRKDVECCFGILKMRFQILAHPIQYHDRNLRCYISKINNTVWACTILHNLLLAYDGLDKLWTEEDYLSTWYADPDAEKYRWDNEKAAHDSLLRQRVPLRMFTARTLGARRPSNCPTSAREVPRGRFASNPSGIAYIDDNDDDPLEWHQDFQPKRLELIAHFHKVWNANKVMWLPFPTKKRKR